MSDRKSSLDIAKIVCACVIPCLHINLVSTKIGYYVCSYIGRLCVPVFFSISGIFLYQSVKKRGAYTAWYRYSAKIIKYLLTWFLIYLLPLVYTNTFSSSLNFVQKLLFMTPAFLWYLTALLFAAAPFCFVHNRIILCKA